MTLKKIYFAILLVVLVGNLVSSYHDTLNQPVVNSQQSKLPPSTESTTTIILGTLAVLVGLVIWGIKK